MKEVGDDEERAFRGGDWHGPDNEPPKVTMIRTEQPLVGWMRRRIVQDVHQYAGRAEVDLGGPLSPTSWTDAIRSLTSMGDNNFYPIGMDSHLTNCSEFIEESTAWSHSGIRLALTLSRRPDVPIPSRLTETSS